MYIHVNVPKYKIATMMTEKPWSLRCPMPEAEEDMTHSAFPTTRDKYSCTFMTTREPI